MKKIFLFMVFVSIFFSAEAQPEFSYAEGDSVYTMKRFVFMLLKSGENRGHDSLEAAKIQALHMAHLDKMAKAGKLVVAGPFENGGEHRGLLIFDVETVEEALKLEGDDPAVVSGRLKMETFFWWGAKGTVIK